MLSPVNFLNSIAIITCCIECRWHTNLSVTFSQRNEPTNNSNENMMQYVAKKLFVCFSFWIAIYSHSNVCTHICWFRARKTFPDTKHFNFSIVPFCSHTHTHIFCVNGLLLLPLLSLFCQFYSCVAYSVGGALEEFGCSLIILFSQPAPLFLRKSAKNLFRIFLWYTFTASGVHVCYSSHAPANFHTQSYIIFLVRVLFSPVFHLILSTRASTKCAYHVLCSAASR